MQYRAIAADYDGTLATDGRVDDATLNALHCYREAGGQLLLVTGRELAELRQVFPAVTLCDGVVAENGAVFWQPQTDQVQLLGEPLPEPFVTTLKARQVDPISQGQVIVATWQPHEQTVRQTIEEMGLAAQVILNKRAVMVLPTGVNKASGLQTALNQLGLSAAEVVGVGDAENDRDLLLTCGVGVAVENALPELKAIAHQVTTQPRGAGVQELVDWILNDAWPA
ncbi:MAG: HAD family phosphatase [Leptolyngbya sp. SIO4C5]|nr:HAD family phosphatase [Leptolyngbya sp. SIO4C5]